ncbi:secondary thiamine-phosphate synthase enzyme YjbQ [Propylenella binzhouense]|uniref:YjbQ family protein n=1 Tax=Propylenella binzhouense TaxID=2555902 RepID=A0A964WTH1_9HYPH|nr:secondary thiamine-phosphate synthase enzyme YjbQ [Propylenella binzhouense]MYZ47988.1 YjbQ family protein [Propylenella binzhouense]
MAIAGEPVETFALERIARSALTVDTLGQGFQEITDAAARFLREAGAEDGLLTLFVRHTSASLAIQENADPDVRHDLLTALDRLAPRNAAWRHDTEGPDDMPAHVRRLMEEARKARLRQKRITDACPAPRCLFQCANEAAWKEDFRRLESGALARRTLALAMASGVSRT